MPGLEAEPAGRAGGPTARQDRRPVVAGTVDPSGCEDETERVAPGMTISCAREHSRVNFERMYYRWVIFMVDNRFAATASG